MELWKNIFKNQHSKLIKIFSKNLDLSYIFISLNVVWVELLSLARLYKVFVKFSCFLNESLFIIFAWVLIKFLIIKFLLLVWARLKILKKLSICIKMVFGLCSQFLSYCADSRTAEQFFLILWCENETQSIEHSIGSFCYSKAFSSYIWEINSFLIIF